MQSQKTASRSFSVGSRGAAERLAKAVATRDPFGEEQLTPAASTAAMTEAANLERRKVAETVQLREIHKEQDQKYGALAYRLKNVMNFNPVCSPPKRLFDSVCPRLRVPLHCAQTMPTAMWATDIRKYSGE